MFQHIYNTATLFVSLLLTPEGVFIFAMCAGIIILIAGVLLLKMPVADKPIKANVLGSEYDYSNEQYNVKVEYMFAGKPLQSSFPAPVPFPTEHVILFINPKKPETVSNFPVRKNAAMICIISGCVTFFVALIGLETIPRWLEARQEKKRKAEELINRKKQQDVRIRRIEEAQRRSFYRRQLSRLLSSGDANYKKRVHGLIRKHRHDEWYLNRLVPMLLAEQAAAKNVPPEPLQQETVVASYWSDNTPQNTLQRAPSLDHQMNKLW